MYQFNLATLMLVGDGLEEPDVATAVRYYELSANQGYAASQGKLAYCYRYGKGTWTEILRGNGMYIT